MKGFSGHHVWRLHATHGFTMDMTIPYLYEIGYVPVWSEILESAKRDGANIKKIIGQLLLIVAETYTPEDRERPVQILTQEGEN